jgi:hypothetical protein
MIKCVPCISSFSIGNETALIIQDFADTCMFFCLSRVDQDDVEMVLKILEEDSADSFSGLTLVDLR